jgi:hypothetical protein
MSTLTIPESSVMEFSPEEMHAQVQRVQHVMEKVMKEGEHYGTIPGCGPKPALLKAGAEKLCFAFRMAPKYDITLTPLTGGHREYQIVCELRHIVTNQLLGAGVGCCSTMESKYRYRKADTFEVTEDPIPRDAKDKKAEYRKQGYGMKKVGEVWKWVHYLDDGSKVENPDIADTFNTVLKMAKKRAHVDAVLTATAASDIFAQDIEENPELYGGRPPEPAKPEDGKSEAKEAKTETQTIEVAVVDIYENDDKALADEGWRGISIGSGRIVETKDAALIQKAKGFVGAGEMVLMEIEWITGKKWPRLKALAEKA